MHIRLKKWVKILLFIIILASLFFIYSKYFGTNGLIVKEYAVVDSRLPNNFYGLKIVQISDIHYKVTTTKDELKSTINEINLLKPDIVIDLDEEKVCNIFASALLLPRNALKLECGEKRLTISDREYKIIRDEYNISIKAIISCLKAYGIITSNYSKLAFINYNTL